MDFIPTYEFRKCVDRYGGNYKVKSFSCWDQYLCMSFAQLTYRESLRDIEACMRVGESKLYHMGLRGRICRNTIAHANETRNWRIYADFAQVLIEKARKMYAGDAFGLELDQTVYALDSTTIDLCLAVFPWAKFRRRKGAIKLHTLMDLRGNIPVIISITHGKTHDVSVLDDLPIEIGAIYIMDRAYTDFARLNKIHESPAFFLTRAKSNLAYKRICSRFVDKSEGVLSDHTITLTGPNSSRFYPGRLRRIRYYDVVSKKSFVFLTNNFVLDALVITQLYKCRWKVELFFKWIKQHLRIKAFYGTTPNAVKTQIWIAISIYLIVAIVKKTLNLDLSLYTILQVLSVSLFEKTSILQTFPPAARIVPNSDSCNQLNLFD
jgi:hypothetical protein